MRSHGRLHGKEAGWELEELVQWVWRAECRREVTVDKELSQTAPSGRLAFRGTAETAEGEAVRKSFVPSGNEEGFCYYKCNNGNSHHSVSTGCTGLCALISSISRLHDNQRAFFNPF